MDVLNPGLYRALKRVFGSVRVLQAGEAFSSRPTRDSYTDEPRLAIDHAGEYFSVCCPFCSDTRFRLYINHVWGQRDAFGRTMSFLAICYNEGCLSKGENRAELVEMLSDKPRYLEELTIKRGRHVREADQTVMLPGPCQRLDTLPPTHKACAYVDARGFDPTKMGRLYGLSYCLDSHYTYARDRLIIPVLEFGKLKGWQARYIGELPWKDKTRSQGLPPKYFTCPGMRRAKLIYNFDNMCGYETGVVVEGPLDVWSFGLMSGCLFGNTMTYYQTKKILAAFRHHSCVLLLDPEEYESASTQRKVRELKQRLPDSFACVKLPDGTDPGSLDREFLRDYIYHEARLQGVEVSWRKRPVAAESR